jgi:hypothetical protein
MKQTSGQSPLNSYQEDLGLDRYGTVVHEYQKSIEDFCLDMHCAIRVALFKILIWIETVPVVQYISSYPEILV